MYTHTCRGVCAGVHDACYCCRCCRAGDVLVRENLNGISESEYVICWSGNNNNNSQQGKCFFSRKTLKIRLTWAPNRSITPFVFSFFLSRTAHTYVHRHTLAHIFIYVTGLSSRLIVLPTRIFFFVGKIEILCGAIWN